MASIDKVDNVAKASIASINAIPAGNIQAVNKVPWVSPPQPFVMNIDTTALTAQTMQLGLTGTGTYNFDVDWGDGSAVQTITSATDPNRIHVYAASQPYTITLTPNAPTGLVEYNFGNFASPNNEKEAYTEIVSWGGMTITLQTTGLFRECRNLNWDTATAGIPLFKSRVIGANNLFRDCDSLTADLSGWGTVADPIQGNLSNLFNLSSPPSSPNFNWVANSVTAVNSAFTVTTYNAPLDNWNTTGVTNFQRVFSNNAVFNQDISSWDLSSATIMNSMFDGAQAFNQDISSWTIPNAVTDFSRIFNNANTFNQPLDSWNVAGVTNMQSAFQGANSFNQDLNSWDVSSVTTMNSMFYQATNFDGNVSSWNTGNVLAMSRMFRQTAKSGGLDAWDVSSCDNFREMFFNASSFSGALSTWNTSAGVLFNSMFEGCPNTLLDGRNWNVQNGANFTKMLFHPSIGFPLNLWQVYSALNMTQMCSTGFTDQQCEDAFVAWSNDPLTATNVNATLIWGTRTYPIGGAMQVATNKLVGASYRWTITGLTFV